MAALGFGAVLSCAVNPATGKRQIDLYGETRELELGKEVERDFAQRWRTLEDTEVEAYVSEVGLALAQVSERPHLPWRFRVLDDPVVNAFALPGGAIYVTRGLLTHLRSEAELAAVLGHEIGHVTARHAVHRLSQQQLLMGSLLLGAVLSSRVEKVAGLTELGLGLLFLRYSRDDERQADQLGLRYLVRLGYDPAAAPSVFEVLQALSSEEARGGLPSWLATHPAPEERRERLSRKITDSDRSGTIARRDELFQATEGLSFGPDPRDPLEIGKWVVWLRAKLLWKLPEDWEREVETRRIATAPAGGELFFELQELEEGSPETAAIEFARQAELRAEDPEPWNSRGLAGQEVGFIVEAEGSEVQGVARFFSVGDRTFRLLGAAQTDQWQRQLRLVRKVLGGVEPLDTGRFPAVQPMRLELIKLSSAMSFQEFLSRYPSPIDPQLLRLINGIAEEETLIPSGSLLRRVVGVPISEWVKLLEAELH